MTGQPSWFDLTSLLVTEPGGMPVPPEIIEATHNFTLTATFDGTDDTQIIWRLYEFFNAPYAVNFYAEGLGAGAPELDLGTATGTLAWGGGPYSASLTTHIDVPGIYRVACTVTFPSATLGLIPGDLVCFIENVLIQIHPVSTGTP